MSRVALFLDRDGVLNIDHGYISRVEDFEPVEGIFEALRSAAARGYSLIVVTNQSGIGRGYFTEQDYEALEAHIQALFAANGVDLTATYHCPHHPDAGCDCRKPKPGMILKAAREYNIDLARSTMIGDKPSDIAAAQHAGVGKAVLVTSSKNIGSIISQL
ncbi:D-glycero-beta-D-manno-heptose 1,7-bisphosphate 7-phosphatase [Sphingobium sp. JS3065]|uniref:D-glycero-beta-D-manno-heptose 1,7-bisphosphate 7-phosphatase n=1 Tax=Sphingobium sp. JS3065 TaxID=2970925 RepID=UPI002264BC79|nr:D-glycero-beta-D-manno-heptose 1,7-bisphosphate 7-phosphatase [Sphingobium sp. JS3065]UZW55075.1 D-glycero-beta-D-manno-heptose 1,7-bisphosphate 7-phosphatase [Sphingobium sp. JS3065]